MGRKKQLDIGDDEYSFPDDPPEPQAPEKENRAAMLKKNKKGGSKPANLEPAADLEPLEGEDEAIPAVFSGKKKPSKSKKAPNLTSAFDALNIIGEEEDLNEEPAPPPKQPKLLENNNHLDDVEDDAAPVVFSGKKKPSKSKKTSNPKSAFDALNTLGEEDINDEPAAPPEQPKPPESNNLLEDGNDGEENMDLVLELRKQQKKKKKKGGLSAKEEELEKILAELGEAPPQPSAAAADETAVVDEPKDPGMEPTVEEAASKKQQKKKKKKSGKTAEEEEDLDKLLAELGEGPPASSSSVPIPPPIVAEEVDAEEKDGAAEGMESAASKKKKKKKEKEKEKKAVSAAAATAPAVAEATEEKEGKGKATGKKPSKHVREMQEAMARRKEEETRRIREEAERARKEEEERLRKEEEERLKEEAKRRKKEKEKEKLLKKKQEGKLLTAKQKEEQKRLEAMRNQFISKSDFPLGDAVGETKKKPRYQTKKAKVKGSNGASTSESQPEVAEPDLDQVNGDDMVEDDSQSQIGEVEDDLEAKLESEEVKSVEEDDDDEDWDAKSWDDIDVALPTTSPFAEEEEEEEVEEEVVPKQVTKKGTERIAPSPAVGPQVNLSGPAKPAGKKVDAASSKKGDAENKEKEGAPESDADTKRKKEVPTKQDLEISEGKKKEGGNDLRSPICCILGHVDTGKTKLLDCIRRTNVQEGEAGGITQQIGATFFPADNIRERTKELKADATLKVPGLLVIDTPGHESFTNLRSRGSSLCDIAIVVVDLMHGLEPQTIESLNLLKSRNTEFIVALNKVDRLYGWKTCPNAPIVKALKQQSKDVMNEFNMRLTQIITEFKEQGLNTALYYKNKDMGDTSNIVPTSAISGEGIPDLLLLLVQWTQKTMVEKLTFVDEVQCTVLEVKVEEGHGTTIDVVLVNGVLRKGAQIVVCGMQGPIVTTIRALLMPPPMKELRVKAQYDQPDELKAAQGIKIAAQGLEHAIAGTALYVVRAEDDLEDIKETVMQDMKKVMGRIDKSGEGVYVQASTLGSLEALTEFLKSPAVNIPFCDFSIGPVHKKDVMKASVMLERKKEYATILAFDVKVMPDARDLAEETGVRIFVADIIYHLFDQFKAYIDNLREEKKKETAEEAVFPCCLEIMPNCIFNKKDPIVLGVNVLEGKVKIGTPICIPSKDFIDIGKVASIEINHKQVTEAKKGDKVAMKIIGGNSEEQQKMFGRHFEMEDELVSRISRRSIDELKANYRSELTNDEWKLLLRLKQLFKIS